MFIIQLYDITLNLFKMNNNLTHEKIRIYLYSHCNFIKNLNNE